MAEGTVAQPVAQSGAAELDDIAGVYARYSERVGRWAQRLGGPGVDVEEVVQEVFYKVLRDRHRFRTGEDLGGWLYGITFHEVLHQRRRRNRPRWLQWMTFEELRPPDPTPLQHLENHDQVVKLYRVLDALPERDRALLVLFELEGKSGEEVARLFSARTATVWVWLHRARTKFAAALKAIEEAP